MNIPLALFDAETAVRALVGMVPLPVWLVAGAAGILGVAALVRFNLFRGHPHA